MSQPPKLEVAVLMRRERVQGPMARWQEWRWVLDDVTLQQDHFGEQARCLRETQDGVLWIVPGHSVELYPDDAEGYMLNATSPAPCFFVMWRMEDAPSFGADPMPSPQRVSLSYHDAGRWLDAQETVEQVAAPADVVQWMREFAQTHHIPEEKKRQRPQSFRALTDRFGQPAKISVSDRSGRKMEGS